MSKGPNSGRLVDLMQVLNEVKNEPNRKFDTIPDSIEKHPKNQSSPGRTQRYIKLNHPSKAPSLQNQRSSHDGRNNSVQRNASPKGAKGVSFETTQNMDDNVNNRRDRDHSSSTDPLLTDSCSDSAMSANTPGGAQSIYGRLDRMEEI